MHHGITNRIMPASSNASNAEIASTGASIDAPPVLVHFASAGLLAPLPVAQPTGGLDALGQVIGNAEIASTNASNAGLNAASTNASNAASTNANNAEIAGGRGNVARSGCHAAMQGMSNASVVRQRIAGWRGNASEKDLTEKAVEMRHSRPGFKACGFNLPSKGGKWNQYCSCDANLKIAGYPAKICHIPMYGIILTLYDPIWSSVAQRMGTEIVERGEYTDLLAAPLLRMGSIVLDIGSNLGDISILLAKLNPTARVIAFEANPRTFKFLQQNVEANGVKAQVTLRNQAVMSADGQDLTVFDCHGSNIAGSTVKAAFANRRYKKKVKICSSQKVPSISFPTILKTFQIPKVDVVKMDCEGREEDVIPQIKAGTVLQQSGECHPTIYHKPEFIEVCCKYLVDGRPFGY